MHFIPGLLKKNIKKWQHKKWYHQRFDGSPYLLHYIAEAEIKEEPRKLNGHNYVHYCFFNNGKADWYIEMEDIKKIYTSLIEESHQNQNISTELLAAWKHDEQQFFTMCSKIKKSNLSSLTKEELLQLHDEFLNTTIQRNTSSSIIDGFALGTDTIIAEMIQDALTKSGQPIKFTEAFSWLTAPVHLSFINEAEVALLKIAVELKKAPARKEELLKDHQQHYFWIRNNYIDAHVLPVSHFNEELETLFALNIDLDKEIKKIANTPQRNLEEKQQLIQKLNLSQELQTLLKISEDFTHWQDERKKASFWTAHYATLILAEISNRIQISIRTLKFTSPREMAKVLAGTVTREELEKRQQNSVFYWDTTGHDCVTGKEADEVKEIILGTTDLSDVDDFRGLTACMGKALGKVRVLASATEISKFQEGEILVAVMTRPDYVPAMKKAAAIVTDEGGVTCHAAIISRELGIPCIIGTKIATKVLQDGMHVEVNANHGWVRVVKR